MDVLLDKFAAAFNLADDPRIIYSLAAAVLLALVSVVSGVGRLDAVSLFRPAVLLRVCVAVAAAFALVVLAQALPPDLQALYPYVTGLALLPLYVVALAYGPSAGLVAGALFSAATAVGPYPGWGEAILILQLLVLGWLAMSPSPRSLRWAGPFNALLAHTLAAGTAGVAFLTWRDGNVTASSMLAEQATTVTALLLPLVLLLAFGPGFYARFFPHSRIAPRISRPTEPEIRVHETLHLAKEPRARTAVATLDLPALDRSGLRRRRRLVEPMLHHEDPNG